MLFKIRFSYVSLFQRFISTVKQNCTPVKLAYNKYKPSQLNISSAPVLFLHGIASSKENWKDISQNIADASKRMTYALDIRNHGDSEWSNDFNDDVLVNDTFNFMDNVNVERAILVGHSMGGSIASRMALAKPNRIEKLILEEAFVKSFTKQSANFILHNMGLWFEGVHKIPDNMSEAEAKEFMVDYVYNKTYAGKECKSDKDRELIHDNRISIMRNSKGKFVVKHNHEALQRAIKNYETSMRKPQSIYDGPTYFIYGTLSPFSLYKDEEYLRKHFPKLQMIKFDGGSHNIHIKYPEKFTNTVLQCILHKD